MKIVTIYAQEKIDYIGKLSACIGYFDGIHRGHQSLFDKVKTYAQKDGSIPTMITFDPDPWAVLKHCDHINHLTTMEERINIADSLGIECVVILHFDELMAHVDIDTFHKMLQQMGIVTLVCGVDFQYAKFGQGNTTTLQAQSYFNIVVCEPIMDGDEKISSSQIERYIEAGDITRANQLLGYPYSIFGEVIKGNQLGRTIGFPTANIQLQDAYIIPKNGVYIAYAKFDDMGYPCMVNVGYNPTFNYRDKISIEAYCIDFHGDLYGLKGRIFFCEYLRGEKRFASKEELVMQLKQDSLKVHQYFEKGGYNHAFKSF